jgi:hypothetical protein
MGPGENGAAVGDKKSRRFVPYENPERRMYKNIVPAPPKETTGTSSPSPSVDQIKAVPSAVNNTEPRTPKRKRQDIVFREQPKQPGSLVTPGSRKSDVDVVLQVK